MGYKEVLDTATMKERFRIDDCISIEDHLSERAIPFYNVIKAKLDMRQLKSFCRSMSVTLF